jgi:hypothetical protein
VSKHSSVQGQGSRKGCKGAAREVAASKIKGLILGKLFVAFVFPQEGHYPRTGVLILFNKIITDLVFPRGFFQGWLPKSRVQCIIGFCFNASADFWLKPSCAVNK